MKLTVQGWQNLLVSMMCLIVLAGVLTGITLVNRTDRVTGQLVDSIQPARIAAYQLQAALRDQETAVRGYAIAADSRFLEPYGEGQRAEAAAAEEIRHYLVGRDSLLRDLDAIENTAASWRSMHAEPLIASVTVGRPSVVAADTADRGKVEFDGLRHLFDAQNASLVQARQDDVDELTTVRNWRNRVVVAMIVAFFALAALLAVLVRAAVTRPLSALASACRRIAEGNFGERIVVRGPKDIQAIAGDVEDMRQRIVDELDKTQSAKAALDRQTEELRRSNAELEQFAYVASHDLQEPLRKVASFCQLLEKRYGDQLDERGAEYIGFAVDGAKRMQVLINDLLAFSRVGRLHTTNTELDLDDVVDAAMNNLAAAIEESGAEIVRPAEPLPRVDGDPTLLVMVWQNLIGNAVKFHREGVAPRVVIGCRCGTGELADQWVFTVTDNGIGIAAEFVDKVFVIFQRLHGRDEYSGTGIGLALCKKIIEHHGGSIWIDTAYRDGTRFMFTLPATPSTQPNELATVLPEGNTK